MPEHLLGQDPQKAWLPVQALSQLLKSRSEAIASVEVLVPSFKEILVVTDDAGADLQIQTLIRFQQMVSGPTSNPQVILPNITAFDKRHIAGTIDPAGNVFEGARRREYPMPPLRGTGFTEMMTNAARTLRWHPFPGPAAITTAATPSDTGAQSWARNGSANIGSASRSATSSSPETTACGFAVPAARLRATTPASSFSSHSPASSPASSG